MSTTNSFVFFPVLGMNVSSANAKMSSTSKIGETNILHLILILGSNLEPWGTIIYDCQLSPSNVLVAKMV
jgi:hypothetical protein